MTSHPTRLNRRALLRSASLCGLAWLGPLARALARAEEVGDRHAPAKSVILLWLQGGPSQLETFDPHPGAKIAGDSKAIPTAVKNIQLGEGLERVAEEMGSIALLRGVVSKEGDHERATYTLKSGYRPAPSLVHPALGAILCHETEQADEKVEIPRFVSIFPGAWPGRGGYLGDQHDAFQIDDPVGPIPDVRSGVPDARYERRVASTRVLDAEFNRGRMADLEQRKTLHGATVAKARRMMTSRQLAAFDVRQESASLQAEYGDTPFGRGCLAAARLIGEGVRCVEVTLGGWDTHVNNRELQLALVQILDPALAALVRDLKRRDVWESTIVLCCGEFGRTPQINPLGGRDHWPHGFSVALAGGPIAGGAAHGETAAEPDLEAKDLTTNVRDKVEVADIHATILHALGVRYERVIDTPINRPIALSEGKVLHNLLRKG